MSSPFLDNDSPPKVNNTAVANANHIDHFDETEISSTESIAAPAYKISDDSPTLPEGSTGISNEMNHSYDTGEKVESTKNGEEEKGTWKPPFDLGTIGKVGEAKELILRLRLNSVKVQRIIEESDNIPQDLAMLEHDTLALTDLFGFLSENYSDDEEVDQRDVDLLQEASTKFEESFRFNFGNVKSSVTNPLEKISEGQRLNNKSEDLKKALQAAYYDSDNSTVAKITSVIDTIDLYNGKVSTLSSFARDNISHLDDSKLLDTIDKGSGRVTKMTSKASEVLDVANNLEILYRDLGVGGNHLGGAAKNLGAVMDLADTAINLLDVPGLNAVQGLWNNVYKPMIDVCVLGISKIEKIWGQNKRDLAGIQIGHWDKDEGGKDNVAPSKYKHKIEGTFEGGWDIFNFMWNVMSGEWHRIPVDSVIKYFEENYDRINAGAKKGDEIPYQGVGPFWKIDGQALMFWALRNKYHLWAMFYGSNLPYPPKTKA